MADRATANAAAETGRDLPIPGLLALLDPEGQRALIDSAWLQAYAAGSAAMRQGEVVDNLLIVDKGIFRAEIPDRHGLPLEVARFSRGDYCGEMSFLRGERASATVRAVTGAEAWLIPHRVLAAVAERQPAVLRELAGVVAGKLADANLRSRQLEPGRVATLVSARSHWASLAVVAAAVSSARHLTAPVVVVDLAGGGSALDGLTHLPNLAALLTEPGTLAECDSFAGEHWPAVGVIEGECSAAETRGIGHLLSELRRRFALVVVHVCDKAGRQMAADGDSDDLVAIREEGQADSSGPSDSLPEVVLLRAAAEPLLSGQIAELSRDQKANVLCVLGGGPEALRRLNDLPRGQEPRPSVDWLARHLIRRKVGIAFGAGGSKGYAHVGVMEQLAAMNVPVDYVAGSSIGAPIAAATAGGLEPSDVERMLDTTFRGAIRLTIPLQSFLSSRLLRRDLEHISQGRTFEQLRKPLAIVAVDLARHSEVIFRKGAVVEAMLASLAIPGIFPPVRLRGRLLVDGALLNPIPNATVATMGADVVVGVKLTNPVSGPRPHRRSRFSFRAPPIVDTIQTAFEVMQWKITNEGAARADVTIEPLFHGPTGLRDFGRGSEFVAAGRQATEAARAGLKELLPWIR